MEESEFFKRITKAIEIIAISRGKMCPSVADADDMFQIGMLAALELYKRENGKLEDWRLLTFAVKSASRKMTTARRKIAWGSLKAHGSARIIEKARSTLQEEYGREPNADEICQFLKMKPEVFARHIHADSPLSRMASLDKANTDGGGSWADICIAPKMEEPEPQVESIADRDMIIFSMEGLNSTEKYVVENHIFKMRPLQDINKQLGFQQPGGARKALRTAEKKMRAAINNYTMRIRFGIKPKKAWACKLRGPRNSPVSTSAALRLRMWPRY